MHPHSEYDMVLNTNYAKYLPDTDWLTIINKFISKRVGKHHCIIVGDENYNPNYDL